MKYKGVIIPEMPASAANYLPYVIHGDLLFVSGQLPISEGKLIYKGKLGESFDLEQGVEAARLVGLNILAVVKEACNGDLDRVKRCIKIGGFVNSLPDFTKQPLVINGCSDLMIEVFGEDRGKHARFAVSSQSLPFNASVEIESLFSIC